MRKNIWNFSSCRGGIHFFLKLLQMYEVFIFLDTHNALTSERGISLALELVFPGELAFPGERRNFLFLPGENRIALLLPGRERTHLLLLPGESRITLFLTGEESTKILILAWERWVSWKSKKTSIEKKKFMEWNLSLEAPFEFLKNYYLYVKSNYFKKRNFSSSFLLACSKHRGQCWPWCTQQPSPMSSMHGNSLPSTPWPKPLYVFSAGK